MKKILHPLLMFTKHTIYGIIIQSILATTLLAIDGKAQFVQNLKEVNLTFRLKEATIQETFDILEKKSGFKFNYNVYDLDRKLTLNGNYQAESLYEILLDISRQANVKFKQVNNNISVSPNDKGDHPNDRVEVVLQTTTVTGKVTSVDSPDGLPGVNVVIKGTASGTVTDVLGNYSIEVSGPETVLVFSSVGFVTEEIEVRNMSSIDVVMIPDITALDEIVVVGYGTQEKGTMTSAVSVVKADAIQKNTVADVSNALSGQAAGLIVRNFNAEPGNDASDIYVRGVSTTGNNDALVVVDGVPDRDLSLIDINDIESVTILKDASAVAPFGSRGANGVILITTKRGKQGKPTINYNTYYGVSKPTRLPQFVSSADYARMFNEASRNEGKTEPFTEDDINKYEAGNNPDYPNTYWWDEIIQKNPIQSQHNLSVSGANENLSYYLSLGAFRQDAYFDRANFKKYNIRANVDANVTKDIKVALNVMGYTDNKQSPNNGGWDAMYNLLENPMRIPNTWPVKNGDGHYVKPSMTNNPIADLDLGGKTVNRDNNFNGSLAFEYTPEFVKGLSLRALGVYDYGASHKKIWQTPYTLWRMVDRVNSVYEEAPPTTQPSLYEWANFSFTTQLEFNINYQTTIAEDHNVEALYVFNSTEWNSNYLEGQRINYASSSIDQLFAGPSDGQSINGSAFEGSRLGHVGRLTYDYRSKYMFEANFRYDGSMKFAPDKRWGFFPSFALGWRLSEENFIKNNLGFIDNLKLRSSWGKAGNDRVGDYQYLATYAMQGTPYSIGGVAVQAAKESRLPNPDITWETATLLDIGIETSMWKGLLTLEADYFFKRTEDILRPTQKTSSIIGIALPDANIGIVESKGFEFNLGHNRQISEFSYYTNFVFTYATNKAVELGEAEGTLNDPFRRRTGKSLNAYYGAISEGLFTSQDEIDNSPSQGGGIAPGDIKYKDFSGPDGVPDGVIDAYDVTKIGYSNVPEIIFGINLGAAYKGFDLTMNFQGATRVNYTFNEYAGYAFYNGGNIQKWQMEERWTEENNNPNARYPRLQTSPSGNNLRGSDYWLRDGTYLRLKTLQLGYSFTKTLIPKLNALRVYVSGQNLFTWVKDDLMTFDPEAYDSRGLFYPQAKVYTVGLNLTF